MNYSDVIITTTHCVIAYIKAQSKSNWGTTWTNQEKQGKSSSKTAASKTAITDWSRRYAFFLDMYVPFLKDSRLFIENLQSSTSNNDGPTKSTDNPGSADQTKPSLEATEISSEESSAKRSRVECEEMLETIVDKEANEETNGLNMRADEAENMNVDGFDEGIENIGNKTKGTCEENVTEKQQEMVEEGNELEIKTAEDDMEVSNNDENISS